MTPRRDDETGRFTEQYARESFLDAVEQHDNATTAEVAVTVGCSYDLAYRRLSALADDGSVRRTKIGATFVWETD